ncbi:general stress protein [Bacillus sp. 1P06AnD]|uniref:general stress protein n=1 Tax=Bacillus sp. 1P06AnD TaxID=3132208 RepID=UPI0039A08315
MAKKVYGVYETGSEVKQVIRALTVQGVEEDDITVIADREETLAFRHYQQSGVETITNSEENETFMDKVIHFFTDDESSAINDCLEDYGFTKEERDLYLRDVQHGKILVLVDEHVHPLNQPTHQETPLTATEYDTLGVSHNPDPNLFAQRDEALERMDYEERKHAVDQAAVDERYKHEEVKSDNEQLSWEMENRPEQPPLHRDERPDSRPVTRRVMTLGELHERQEEGNDPARNGRRYEEDAGPITESQEKQALKRDRHHLKEDMEEKQTVPQRSNKADVLKFDTDRI